MTFSVGSEFDGARREPIRCRFVADDDDRGRARRSHETYRLAPMIAMDGGEGAATRRSPASRERGFYGRAPIDPAYRVGVFVHRTGALT